MSLKDLISSLIEAVFGSKKAFISNQAMPNVASHITLANNVGNETEFVAPSNGYVCLQGQSNAVNNELYLVSNELRSSSCGVNGWGVRVFLPIGKGQSFKASSNGLAFNALTFISSIGGGINRLLSQAVRDVLGGGLCLSYLATFERSLSLRLQTRKNGLVSNLCRKVYMLLMIRQLTGTGIRLLHLATDMQWLRLCRQILEFLSVLTMQSDSMINRKARLSAMLFLFRLKRAKDSIIELADIREAQQPRLDSSTLSASASLAYGGAL